MLPSVLYSYNRYPTGRTLLDKIFLIFRPYCIYIKTDTPFIRSKDGQFNYFNYTPISIPVENIPLY